MTSHMRPARGHLANDYMSHTSEGSTESMEDCVMEHLMNMIASIDIPPLSTPMTAFYKILVRHIRKRLRESGLKLSMLDIEVYARKMALWVEQVSKTATTKSLANIEARKMIPSNNEEIMIGQLIEDTNRENILIEKLDSDSPKHSFNKTGDYATLRGKYGEKIKVEGVIAGRKEKTLVKKENADGDIDTWVVEVADKDQIKSIEALTKLKKATSKRGNDTDLGRKISVDKWKMQAEIKKEEADKWKKKLELIDSIDKKKRNNPDTSYLFSGGDTSYTGQKGNAKISTGNASQQSNSENLHKDIQNYRNHNSKDKTAAQQKIKELNEIYKNAVNSFKRNREVINTVRKENNVSYGILKQSQNLKETLVPNSRTEKSKKV